MSGGGLISRGDGIRYASRDRRSLEDLAQTR
jgi:hypothetical protein